MATRSKAGDLGRMGNRADSADPRQVRPHSDADYVRDDSFAEVHQGERSWRDETDAVKHFGPTTSASTRSDTLNLIPNRSHNSMSNGTSQQGAGRTDYPDSLATGDHVDDLDSHVALIRGFRRVDSYTPALVRQHRSVAETAPEATDRSSSKATPVQGVSAFLGRVLNQLSLSAWLPAAMLVGSLAVLVQLHSQKDRDVGQAITLLAAKPLGILVLLLFAIVLATLVTQAFEFEVIRLLEGYWGSGFIGHALSRIFIRRQLKTQDHLLTQREDLQIEALHKADLPKGKSYLVDYIDDEIRGLTRRSVNPRVIKRTREARSFDWDRYAPADLMCRVQAIGYKIEEYPEEYRMLPMKLGNILRTAEDSINSDAGTDLESFVVRRWDRIPNALQKEHDQYRTRLDLYCTLVFVFAVLGVAAPLLITRGMPYLLETVLTSLAYLVMSFVSYSAAIASARGYGVALKAIADLDLNLCCS